ncbi:hypothetical protein LGV61_09895 [Desulfurispirillum indicum]|uniref:hypothetical protein n=1 Tax=Desulfurispirillum indicum TaxID=936456 RepID=UPI001CF9CC5F|nr:hypothetical protein [Desulfurispirillum indicum]UCZ56032.1 hypothetical protein LGV61_09895 [Desulfurispirillum indicum]
MKPEVKVRSTDQDERLNSILNVITDVDCRDYFSSHLGEPQHVQKAIVANFQKSVFQRLQDSIPSLSWMMEYTPSKSQKDSIDIYGESEAFVVAIELDKNRADQVAKKFVSRIALLPDKKVYFLSLCYPGTAGMNLNECVKYFGYCANLAKRMSGVYAGLVIGKI